VEENAHGSGGEDESDSEAKTVHDLHKVVHSLIPFFANLYETYSAIPTVINTGGPIKIIARISKSVPI